MQPKLPTLTQHRRSVFLQFLATIIVLPLLCCGGPLLVNPLYNNLRIARLKQAFVAYPLPPQTTRLQAGTVKWLVPLNGGTCVVNVEQQLLTALSYEEITAYYADVFFPPLRHIPSRDDNRVGVVVDRAETPEPDGRHKVTILAGEPFFDAGLDLRCPV